MILDFCECLKYIYIIFIRRTFKTEFELNQNFWIVRCRITVML